MLNQKSGGGVRPCPGPLCCTWRWGWGCLRTRLPIGAPVQLLLKSTDRYGRVVGEVIGAIKLGLAMVEDGQASEDGRYVEQCDASAYLAAEARARQRHSGVWQLPRGIDRPWEFRRSPPPIGADGPVAGANWKRRRIAISTIRSTGSASTPGRDREPTRGAAGWHTQASPSRLGEHTDGPCRKGATRSYLGCRELRCVSESVIRTHRVGKAPALGSFML
jgi:hypothetical protein